MGDCMRFKSHCMAPKSGADFAFLLHGIHFLKDEGVRVNIFPVNLYHYTAAPSASSLFLKARDPSRSSRSAIETGWPVTKPNSTSFGSGARRIWGGRG